MDRSRQRRHGAPHAQPLRWRRPGNRTAAAAAAAGAAVLLAPAPPATAHAAPVRYESGVHEIVATAYCLDGTMANGESTHHGAAAMRGVPLGTPVAVLDGPEAGRTLLVKDRVPKRGVLDIWMDDCRAARQHGSRRVSIDVQG